MTGVVDEAQRVDLDITGMTCASCAARIEKRLNRLQGGQRLGQFRPGAGGG